MDAIAMSPQMMLNYDITEHKLIKREKNLETQIICKTLTETSPSYNVITLANGKYILLMAPDLSQSKTNVEIETYIEVDSMNDGLVKKINNIYNGVIISSLIIMLISMINISYNLVNIKLEYSIATIICTLLGCIAMIVDKIKYNKGIYNE